MEIQKIQIKLNRMVNHTFDSIHGIVHQKKLFQFSIVQLPSGTYHVSTDGNLPVTCDGEIFIASPMQTQLISIPGKDRTLAARRIFLNMDINAGGSIDFYYEFPTVPPPQTQERICDLMEQLTATKDPFDQNIYCWQIAKELFSCAKERTQPFHPKLIQLLQYIRKHSKEKLAVYDMASQNQISESQVYSLFRKYCHCTPVSYLNQCRLDAAAHLLLTTSKTVAEIAAEVGFEDYSYFSKCFKRIYHLSPSHYRNTTIFKDL